MSLQKGGHSVPCKATPVFSVPLKFPDTTSPPSSGAATDKAARLSPFPLPPPQGESETRGAGRSGPLSPWPVAEVGSLVLLPDSSWSSLGTRRWPCHCGRKETSSIKTRSAASPEVCPQAEVCATPFPTELLTEVLGDTMSSRPTMAQWSHYGIGDRSLSLRSPNLISTTSRFWGRELLRASASPLRKRVSSCPARLSLTSDSSETTLKGTQR